jgi:RNA polymerase sigma-70 factor (ECF subfamily)
MLAEHANRLERMVAFRLNARLRGRIDPSDVVQDAFLEASAHRETFFKSSGPTPLFLWLRGIVANKLLALHRHHLGTRMRDAARELSGDRAHAGPDATSAALIAHLSGHATGPRTAAARAEVKARLHEALQQLDAIDREVLALRHFEQLSNGEAANVLGIQERAAAKRYVRALKRLKDLLAAMPAGLTGLMP